MFIEMKYQNKLANFAPFGQKKLLGQDDSSKITFAVNKAILALFDGFVKAGFGYYFVKREG